MARLPGSISMPSTKARPSSDDQELAVVVAFRSYVRGLNDTYRSEPPE
jgi:hypothetical protein